MHRTEISSWEEVLKRQTAETNAFFLFFLLLLLLLSPLILVLQFVHWRTGYIVTYCFGANRIIPSQRLKRVKLIKHAPRAVHGDIYSMLYLPPPPLDVPLCPQASPPPFGLFIEAVITTSGAPQNSTKSIRYLLPRPSRNGERETPKAPDNLKGGSPQFKPSVT